MIEQAVKGLDNWDKLINVAVTRGIFATAADVVEMKKSYEAVVALINHQAKMLNDGLQKSAEPPPGAEK